MKKILSLVMIMALMTGCSSKATVTVCSYSETGVEASVEFTAKKDIIQSQVSKSEITFEALGITKDDQVTIDEYITSFNETNDYGDVEGVTALIETTETGFQLTHTFDYSGTNLKKLVDAGVVDIAGADVISLEQTVENIKSSGFTCSEK